MKRYTQLTDAQRAQISRFRGCKFSISEIARRIGVNKSTISRELKRNGAIQFQRYDKKLFSELAILYDDPILLQKIKKLPKPHWKLVYETKRAKQRARQRRYWSNQARTRKQRRLREWVINRMIEGWTPTQIAGRSKIEGPEAISHETVYQIIKRDRKAGGELYKMLPRFGRRKQRFNAREYKTSIPDRVDIKERPKVVNERSRLGDLEADLICGYKADGYVLVVVDRRSRQVALVKLRRKTKLEVLEALLGALGRFPIAHTLTVDNGREFSAHKSFTDRTGVKVYFATPYTSQERGTVENTNGVLRRDLKKGAPFSNLEQSQLDLLEQKFNNRPRQVIGFLTPNEIANMYRHNLDASVALQP